MTPKQVLELTAACHRMKTQGLSRREIARTLGIPADTVSVLISGWGRGRPKVSIQVRGEIAKLAKKGLSHRVIAEKVGVSIGTAHKYAEVEL